MKAAKLGTSGHDRTAIWAPVKPHRLFVTLLIVYLTVALWFSFRLPAFSGPNEGLHYEYVALIRKTGKLPDISTSSRQDERHQPPVYYSLVALASLPFPVPPLDTELKGNPCFLATHRGNLNPIVHASPYTTSVIYVGRLASVFLGVLGLFGVYLTARRTLSPEISGLVASLMAFQPTFLFLSATINNDLAVTVVGVWLLACTTWLIVHDKPPRTYALWGLLFAAAMLTKANAFFFILLLPIACLAKWRNQGQLWPAVKCGLWGLLGFIPFWGAWLIFNQLRDLDPLGISATLPIGTVLRQSPSDLTVLRPYAGTLWRSFWLDWSPGDRGYAPNWFYVVWGLVLLISLAGWLQRKGKIGQPLWLPWIHLSVILSLGWSFLATKALMVEGFGYLVPEGRWMLPALPSLAWLVGVGWARWWSDAGRRRACLLASLVPLVSTSLLVVSFLPTLYPQAQQLSDASRISPSAHSVRLTYGDKVELLAVQSEPLTIDQEARITLYWQALDTPDDDYIASIQLLVPSPGKWDRLDSQSSYPGSGLTPTGDWERGDVYRDRVLLYPQGDLSGPTRALLGVWLLEDQSSLSVARDGELIEMPIAQEVVVYPAEPQIPDTHALLQSPVNYGGLFDLVGISQSEDPGNLEVTLWWEAQADVPADYTIFVHLINSEGQIIAQDDGMPDRGRSPTHLWQPGDMIRDTHWLESDVTSADSLLIGVYDLTTMTRLSATQGQQPLPDNAFRLRLTNATSTEEGDR